MDHFVETNQPGYYKDPRNGGIINRNRGELQTYRFQRAAVEDKHRLQTEVNSLHNELSEIRAILLQVMNK
jgi:hypothetical protein